MTIIIIIDLRNYDSCVLQRLYCMDTIIMLVTPSTIIGAPGSEVSSRST